ncbi:hypothetical protein PV10_07198 [Exophiala mesophila]|uniref:Heterokaryon incompatibility domain-containing protein n=1 Tax=Exophiala mesophila TaxID=212818 RepID=A0A0D1ZSL2_EXOME|nr:uncharacterized protein PV10_07198 [Exophiala mesophila]KIV89828.1 hypothetical protein PV10_07198 [Exophiala mesophila]
MANMKLQVEFNKHPARAFSDVRSFETDLRLVTGWIQECALNHENCKRGQRSWYPTRLLHFESKAQNVKLIVSKENPPNGPYVTLSHRWGQHKYETLKPSTMQRLKKGIDAVTLPQIFQDAIQIAQALGVHYLWIDGLCIQQGEDYRSDWARESQQMDQVYSNAFFNISATLSEDGTESLFHRRSWRSIIPSRIQIDMQGRLEQYYVLDGDIWKDEVDEAPLSTRGWVFQERILAPRVIHFGPSQIGWECKELEALEMFPNGLPQMCGLSTMRKSDILQDPPAATQDSGSTDLDGFVDLWQQLVSAYSRCALSQPGDKLVAFLGIAKKFMQSRTDTYIAGMWEKTLTYDLAWNRATLDIEDYPLSKTSCRAPSWSWASVDGEIEFPKMLDGVRDHFVSDMQLSTTVDNSTPAVRRSKVQARGLCLPLRLKWSNRKISGVTVAGLHFMAADEEDSDQKIVLEDSTRAAEAGGAVGRLLLLPLFTTTHLLVGLVLIKTRGVNAHLRVGSVQLRIMAEPVGEITPPKDMKRERDGNRYWSVPALKLRLHILGNQRQVRKIEIF